MKSPDRLGHVVLKTYDVERLRKWYCDAFGGHVVYERLPILSFIAYDDEHHRIAFGQIPGTPPESRGPSTLHHMGFFFDSVRDLLRNYVELKSKGILPNFPVNHGPVLSLYYADPDGNGVEFAVDRFKNSEEIQDFIDKNFARNPAGVSIDPEKLVAMMEAGASDEELLFYDYDAPMAEIPWNANYNRKLKEAIAEDVAAAAGRARPTE